MQEREDCRDYLKELFWQTYQRIEKLEQELPHSPGCIVRKGSKKQYTYWQIRQNGRQVQQYVKAGRLPEVMKQIQVMKAKKSRLRELRQFLSELKRMLRDVQLRWQEVLSEYREKRARRDAEKVGRAAAKEAASKKKYAPNYHHLTDKGDYVASKSEEIIANVMYAAGVRYEYERELVIDEVRLKPDFTVWREDGSMVIWEHAGLLGDVGYRKQFERKLDLYKKAGFTQMKSLIVTYDENGAFSAATARRMIEAYALV